VFSVTSEAAASASIQAAQPRTTRTDRPAQSDDFGALLDSSLPAETQDASSIDRQTAVPQRRADDAAATSDKGRPTSRSRDASDDQSTTGIGDDSGSKVRQTSDAEAPANAKKNTAAPRSATKADSSKDGSSEQSAKASAGADSSADPAASTPQGPTSLIIPAAIAVAIPVPVALTDVPAVPTSNASTTAPLALAIAAASVAAGASAAPAPASPPDQTKSISDAVDATVSATSSIPASDAGPLIAAAGAAAAVGPEKAAAIEAAVIEASGQSTALPIPQAATQIAATPVSDGAFVAAAATSAATPKTILPKAAAAVTAKGAASTSDANSAASDRSATGTDLLGSQPKAEQSAAVKPETGNDNPDRTKSDASATKASPAIDSAPVRDHSVLAPTTHPNDSSEASSQTAAVLQPPLSAAPATTISPTSLSVTAASNGLVPVSGLAFEIAASARSGKSRFDIRLDPADLGRIDVRIDVDRTGQVTSHLTVEKPETLSMLRQDAPQLQRALDDAGFKTGDGGLQFSLRDQSSSGNNSGNETSRNAQRLVITDDETIPAAIAGRRYGRVLGSTSGVDIRV
jgi:flagellar hook-length control protein FliK